ncbi:MAG: class I SAM-dependent RNA methyltransferase [bacterium]
MRISIEKMVHGGMGLGSADGLKVFVPFSAPGDLLEVEATAERHGFVEAKIISIEKPAPCRVEPRCPVFGRCGGCQWQHMEYAEQLKWKRLILVEQLERIGKVRDPNVLSPIPSPAQWHYRNRMQLHVDSKGRVGFYRPKSKEVVEFSECAIAAEDLNRELNLRREEFSRRDRGIALRLSPGGAFSQINSGQNENLKRLVCEWLMDVPHESVLELHAGSGNFSFALAGVAGEVVATEIDGRAVEAAEKAQAELGLCNLEFRRMSAERAVRRFAGGRDALLLDPPRKGCPEAIDAIVRAAPRTVLYISCDPATLSRDVHALVSSGYDLVRAAPVDMFPQTFHIEALAMLARR